MRLMIGRISRISSVSPEFDSASTTSAGVIMPRSPCEASPGCTKNDGVPVEASVAAILLPMWPDLPMPVTTTRPVPARTSLTGARELRVHALGERGERFRLDLDDVAAELLEWGTGGHGFALYQAWGNLAGSV